MTTSPHPIVIGLGELLWDDFPDGKRPGGAPANVAFQANQLGYRGLVASRVGNDADGEELLQYLRAKELDQAIVQQDLIHPTGRVTVQLTNGSPSYEIHEGVAWDYMELDAPLKDAMQEAAAVCFGTLAQRSAKSRETIHAAVTLTPADCLRVYDVNFRQRYFQKDWVEASLRLASIVKLNDEEVEPIGTLLGLSTDQTTSALELIENYDLEMVCITRGPQGCLLISRNETHDIPGRPVKVADTVGAGDAFTAGLIVSLLRKWPLALAGEFANRIGGMVASRQGAMPDLRVEFAQLLEQYSPI